jgi:DNA polymerase-1
MGERMIGLDVETTGLTPHDGRLSLVQAAAPGRPTALIDAFAVDPALFLHVLDGCNESIVAHNANFEELWMREYGFHWHLEDTLVMSRVLHGGTDGFKRLRHTLADVVRRELGETVAKDERLSDWSRRPLTQEQLEYAARDAEILVPLAGMLIQRLYDEGLMRVYQLENRVRPAVDAMERRGVAMHRRKLEALIDEYTAKACRLRAELEEEWAINPGSGKQIAELFSLYERKDWPKTRGGAPKTDQDAMKKIRHLPGVEKWIEWKEAEKIRSTYGKSILEKLGPDDRIHARFKAFGTATAALARAIRTSRTSRSGGSAVHRCAGSSGVGRRTACS